MCLLRASFPRLSGASDPTEGPAVDADWKAFEDVETVYSLSDLHTDHPQNLQWLRDRMKRDAPSHPAKVGPPRPWCDRDLLVVAGDVSHDQRIFEQTLSCLREPGCQVVFVPGNHEAWLNKGERDDSLRKLDRVYQTCRDLGVVVDPCYVPGNRRTVTGALPPLDETVSSTSAASASSGPAPLWIVPLQSWYDGTLGFSDELCQGFEHWPWVDFARCRWPPSFPLDAERLPKGLVEHLLDRNEPLLRRLRHQEPAAPSLGATSPLSECTVLTVTHFLPCPQTLPDWVDLSSEAFDVEAWLDHGAGEMSAKFAKVAGSKLIDEQLRSLITPFAKRHLHVFGHSHRPKDLEYRSIRYIHNPLGKPREREMHMVNPDVDFQVLWSSESPGGEVPGPQLLRYWEEHGGGKEALWERLELLRLGRY